MTDSPKRDDIPTVAIVGRPNVGKSSLFNAIIGHRLAIVHQESGVTRDRIVAPVNWHGKHFQLVDTGGLGTFSNESKHVDMWDQYIRQQVEAAIEGADILLFIVDAMDGMSPLDEEVATTLRESGRDIHLVANKADNATLESQAEEFAALGFDTVHMVSCLHRRGIDGVLSDALRNVKVAPKLGDSGAKPFRIAVVGRPNVGKSSLVNALLGEKRVMVSDVAGTTRDSVDTDFELSYKGESLAASLIDTAGLRKRSKVDNAIEKFSVMRAESAIKRADLVLFVVEARHDGVTAQDRRVAQIIADAEKGCVIVANKWDECEGQKQKHVLDEIRYTLPRMTYSPVVFTCALTGYHMELLLDSIAQVISQMEIHVPTSVLNRVVEDAVSRNSPPVAGKRPFKIYYGTMVSNQPPRFVLFVNSPKLCMPHYLNYLNNCLRQAFDFIGLPIIVMLRERPKTIDPKRRESKHKKSSPTRPKKADKAKGGKEPRRGKAGAAKQGGGKKTDARKNKGGKRR